jgi:hypothetical protein
VSHQNHWKTSNEVVIDPVLRIAEVVVRHWEIHSSKYGISLGLQTDALFVQGDSRGLFTIFSKSFDANSDSDHCIDIDGQ